MKKLPGSGRPKGSPNRVRVSKIREVLAENGINPAEKILELMHYLEPSDQLKAWCFLAGYCEPKPSEVDGAENRSEDLAERTKELTDEELEKSITYNGARDVSGS